jgi:hypothetical protein
MITGYAQQRIGDITRVHATSDLIGFVYYHWYLDGAYAGMTAVGWKDFTLTPDEQGRIEAVDTADPDFDPIAGGPDGYPARRTIEWVRSLEPNVRRYRIDQLIEGGNWQIAGYVENEGHWLMRWTSGRLEDLTTYTWRIVPVDMFDNEGVNTTIGPEKIVRNPDAPRFSATLSAGKVTFAE